MLAALVAAMMVAPGASASHSVSKDFLLTWPQGDVASGRVGGPTTVMGVPVPAPAIGGVTISSGEQLGQKPVGISITTTGDGVGYTICQDLNGDARCGVVADGEPRSIGCNEGEVDSSQAWNPTLTLVVFVRNGLVACSGAAIPGSGTVTVFFA